MEIIASFYIIYNYQGRAAGSNKGGGRRGICFKRAFVEEQTLKIKLKPTKSDFLFYKKVTLGLFERKESVLFAKRLLVNSLFFPP